MYYVPVSISFFSDYVFKVLDKLIQKTKENKITVRGSAEQNIKPPLCSQYNRPQKAAAILEHRSRFNK